MKRLFSLIVLVSAFCSYAGCGSSNAPAPAVKVLSGDVSRTVVSGTSIAIDVAIQPNFTPAGTLYITAVDKTGIFKPVVSVTANSDASYTLTLATSATAATGHYTGTVTLNQWSDAACTIPQQVPSVTVPFDINAMSSTSAWPGNNLSALSVWPGVPDWTMYQGNAAHTGYVPVTVDPNQFTTRWTIPAVTGAVSSGYGLPAAPTTAGGQLFVAGNNFLYARKEFDGSLAWQYDFSGLQYPSVNPPAVADGAVFMAAGQQSTTFLFAFNAADGSLIFKSPMNSQWEHYLAPTIGAQGIYTNAGTSGGLFAFDQSGLQLFFDGMAQTSMWTPAVDATGVYTYTGGVLKVVDPKSGAVLNSISDPTFQNYVYEIGGSPVLGAPGSVFVANYENSLLNGGAIGNTLINFSISNNAIAWQIPGVYPSTPAYSAGTLYVANEKPLRLEARAEADGRLLWSWVPPQAGDVNFISEVLLTKNLVFVSTNLATYAIDVTSHRNVWSYPLSGRLALSQNGIFYIEGQSMLIAINLK
ncbi:MAG: PQQ-binding-like beta-propeller repeat protein [Oryzomonas sp.]|uniref:outer membrane protein assembly factor BamB family protein n=1 Tax=Oryzomonas sp. TaxID=2855186 RepID=UPI00284FEBAE|nr:PQQ-binding-like beta-propeller repeat protein [Oryzomonas sp.]MDR3580013.1 PQQ-binding-like beta-propeller repeat protein [Oryzomonas sp.]